MILFFLLVFFELFLCRVVFSPTLNTDLSIMSLLLLTLNAILFFSFLSNLCQDKEWKKLNGILFLSFILRIILLLWDVYCRNIWVLPNAEGDAMGYHGMAISYAFGGRQNLFALTDYSFYVGQIYKAIGVQRTFAQFINICFSMAAISYMYKSALLVNISEKYRNLLVVLLCFLPNFILIDSILLQEAAITFFISMSIYHYTKWWKENKALDFILAMIFSVIGAFLHVGGLVCAVGFAVTCIFVNNQKRAFKITAGNFLLALAMFVSALLVISIAGNILFRKIGGDISAEAITSKVGVTDRISDADYNIGVQGLSPGADLVVNSPLRMLYFVCAPVPWMWRGIPDLVAFWGSAIFYIMTFCAAWKCLRLSTSDEENISLQSYQRVLFFCFFVAMLMFGWGVSNNGTALRHREKFTCMCALLYVVSRQRIENMQKQLKD